MASSEEELEPLNVDESKQIGRKRGSLISTETALHKSVDNVEELCEGLAEEARVLQQEYVYTRQKVIALLEERSLIRWQLAANGKGLEDIRHDYNRNADVIQQLEFRVNALVEEGERLERERDNLQVGVERIRGDIEKLTQELNDTYARLEDDQYKVQEEDHYNPAAARRLADLERQKRITQLKKLQQAVAARKKWKCKIDTYREWDLLINEAYQTVKEWREPEYSLIDDVVAPLRQKLVKDTAG